jgi:pimeloyl-ACP methyl ester carboxylesterase
VRPDLAGRLVLLGTAGRSTAFLRLFFKAYYDASSSDVEGGDNIRTVLMLLGQMGPSMITNDDIVGAVAASQSSVEMARRAFRSAADFVSLEALAKVTAPTLVIGFELDVLMPATLGREVADAITGARYVEIAGATHAAPLTHTKEIMEAALPFISEGVPATVEPQGAPRG